MNKEEILDEINKTEEHLANMKKMLAECEYERWKPKEGEIYYELNKYEKAISNEWFDTCYDNVMFNLYNVFRTCEQARAEAEKILVRRMLEDIARRLNKGEKIDWKNSSQYKYSFYLDDKINKIDWCRECRYTVQGSVYCLDMNFYNVAIQEIGEERLKKYLRGE